MSYQIRQLEGKWAPIWGDIDALAGRWDELIGDAGTYLSLLQQQFEAEVNAIKAAAEARKEQIRAEAEAQKEALRERIDAIQEEISALRRQRAEVERLRDQWKGVIDTIKNRLQELQFGPEAPVQSWAAYQARWMELLEEAKTNPEAVQRLIDFSREYLEMAKIYAPDQYMEIWQEVMSALQGVEDKAISEVDLLQAQIDSIDAQTEMLENQIEQIRDQMEQIDRNVVSQLEAIDAQVEEQINALKQAYASRMMDIYNRLQEVGEYLRKQIEEQMPEDIKLLTETTDWLERIYTYLVEGVPSAQTGGVTTREGLYRLHPNELILPRGAGIRIELDYNKLGRALSDSLMKVGIPRGDEGRRPIRLVIDGREIAMVTAEQIRRGHPELIKQVRRASH